MNSIGCVILFLIISSVDSYYRNPSFNGEALTDREYKQSMGDAFIFMEIIEPSELRYTYKLNPSPFASVWNISYHGARLVLADPYCGCSSFNNEDDVEGNVVMIVRGECSFVSKVIKAQEAGALAAIITDDDVSNDSNYISMVDDITKRKVNIPAAFLLGINGKIIRDVLSKQSTQEAIVNVPINISSLPINELNQPPWLVW